MLGELELGGGGLGGFAVGRIAPQAQRARIARSRFH